VSGIRFQRLAPETRNLMPETSLLTPGVEAPGTAPGSDRLITMTIYRHSRTNPAPPNIGKIEVEKKLCLAALADGPLGGPARWHHWGNCPDGSGVPWTAWLMTGGAEKDPL